MPKYLTYTKGQRNKDRGKTKGKLFTKGLGYTMRSNLYLKVQSILCTKGAHKVFQGITKCSKYTSC